MPGCLPAQRWLAGARAGWLAGWRRCWQGLGNKALLLSAAMQAAETGPACAVVAQVGDGALARLELGQSQSRRALFCLCERFGFQHSQAADAY